MCRNLLFFSLFLSPPPFFFLIIAAQEKGNSNACLFTAQKVILIPTLNTPSTTVTWGDCHQQRTHPVQPSHEVILININQSHYNCHPSSTHCCLKKKTFHPRYPPSINPRLHIFPYPVSIPADPLKNQGYIFSVLDKAGASTINSRIPSHSATPSWLDGYRWLGVDCRLTSPCVTRHQSSGSISVRGTNLFILMSTKDI